MVLGYQIRSSNLVFGFLQCILRRLIELLEDINLYRTTLAATNIVKNPVNSLFRIVPRDGGLRVCQQSSVGLERFSWSAEDKKQ